MLKQLLLKKNCITQNSKYRGATDSMAESPCSLRHHQIHGQSLDASKVWYIISNKWFYKLGFFKLQICGKLFPGCFFAGADTGGVDRVDIHPPYFQ